MDLSVTPLVFTELRGGNNMQISINNNSEIISYVLVGGIRNGIEIEKESLPSYFIELFKPKKFKYENGEVINNPNYVENESGEGEPVQDTNQPIYTGSDAELRKTYGNLQMSSVQTAKVVNELSRQVAELTKENVALQQKISETEVK